MKALDLVVSDKKIFENCILMTYFLTLWPTYATNWNGLNNFVREPPRDHSCEVWTKSNEWFQRRCCLKKLLTHGRTDRRWTTDNGPSQKLTLSTLCSGELKWLTFSVLICPLFKSCLRLVKKTYIWISTRALFQHSIYTTLLWRNIQTVEYIAKCEIWPASLPRNQGNPSDTTFVSAGLCFISNSLWAASRTKESRKVCPLETIYVILINVAIWQVVVDLTLYCVKEYVWKFT